MGDGVARHGPPAATRHRYDAAAVLRRMFPRPVAVGLAVAVVFIGAVILAGALLRHRDTHPTHHPTGTPAPATTGRPRP